MTRQILSEPTTLDLEMATEARVRIVDGDVSVTATEGPPRLVVHGLSGPGLEVDQDGDVLSVAYDDLGWGGLLSWVTRHNRWVSLTLFLPPGTRVQVGVVSASALVAGMTGGCSVRSVSGEVTLDGLRGPVEVRTVSGDVEAQALAGDLRFDTVSGSLTVVEGSGRSVQARTVSGEITLDLEPDPVGNLELRSVSGDVVLRLPESAGTTVSVRSTSGSLRSGFDGLSPSSRPGDRRLEGTIGDGAGRLKVRTVSGDVAVLSRAAVE